MPFCGNCGSQLNEQDRFCNACGAPTAPGGQPVAPTWAYQPAAGASSVSGGFMGGQVIAAIGSLMLLIGPFLAWMSASSFFGGVSVSGLQKTGNEALAMVVLGVLGLVAALVALAIKRGSLNWLLYVEGIICLALGIWYYVQLSDQLSDVEADAVAASIGSGIYLCLVGSILVLVGAIVTPATKKRQPRQPSVAS